MLYDTLRLPVLQLPAYEITSAGMQWCAGITNQVGHVGVAPLKTLMDQGIQ